MMALTSFFDASDAARAERTLHKLALHDISGWALTGGVAIELQIFLRAGALATRPLHDIDFIADSFASIPQSMADSLLLRHVHPDDSPGKTMLQAVDPESRVRVDLFRAYGGEMERASRLSLGALALRVVSIEDLVARHARLNWDVLEGKPVAPKYAHDFRRLLALVEADEIEEVWQEHRKPHFPASFAEAVSQLRSVTASRPELLVASTYSTDVLAVCPRCKGAHGFPLAEPSLVLSLLGYC
ncbi:MAG: hypothetical protein ABSD13_00350 [Candidatus Korobacteraceae bacterium]|jgi:hypothetical protein